MNDDNVVATIVRQFRVIIKDYPTTTKLTATFNLLIGYFRLCCVQGDPEDLKKMAKDIYDELILEIPEEREAESDPEMSRIDLLQLASYKKLEVEKYEKLQAIQEKLEREKKE